MRNQCRWLGLMAFGMITACNGAQQHPPDAADDVVVDSSSDAGTDEDVAVGNDANIDAGSDALIDTVDDAGADVVDAGMDVATDDGDDVLPPLDVAPTDAADDGEVALPNVCAGDDRSIASRPGESRYPIITWTGTEYGVVWQDNEDGDWETNFARIAADGTIQDGAIKVTDDEEDDIDPTVTWDGSHYVLAWAHSTGATTGGASIRTSVISRGTDGTWHAASALTVTDVALDYADTPVIERVPAASGGGFGVVWEDGRNGANNHELYFAALDATGARRGANVRVTNASRISYSPVMHWNARLGEFGVLWLDDRDGHGASANEELYFARLTTTGAHAAGTSDVRVTNDDEYRSLWPSFTYDATGLAVSWANEGDIPDRPHVFFSQLDDSGNLRAGGADRLAISQNPPDIGAWTTAVGWNGTEYLVVWEDQRHTDGDLVVRRVSAAGTLLTNEVFLNDDSAFTGHPSLVWSGTNWSMVWEDDRDVHRDPFFRSVGRTDCLN